MRRLVFGMVLALALSFAATAATAPAATKTVQITKTGFVPQTVTINVNDAVTWKNADTVNHQVVANNGQFASPILTSGQSYTHTFNRSGTFRYHDALHSTLSGTVVVNGPPPPPAQVTLVASAATVKFGTQVTLSGAVSNKKAGEPVTLVSMPWGQTTKQVIANLQTGSGGTFSFTVTPQIQTLYQAQWKNLSESSVTVQVAPKIKLPAPSSSGWYHFYVAPPNYAGHFVFLQRFTLYHQWVSIAKLTLGTRSGRLISVGQIRHMIPRGRWSVRVLMTADQVGPGYLETSSGSQPVVRRR
jgi:plastocyanin